MKHIRPVPVLAVCLVIALIIGFRHPLWHAIAGMIRLMEDGERIRQAVFSFGAAAPAVFVFLQVLQVVLAPFPGEISGFVGGYLFGALNGFLLSSIGLTLGSWINFSIGRVLGRRYIRKLVPDDKRKRIDRFVRHQGVMAVFVLFVFPGFPKDYLCLFLGLSKLPVRIFLLLAGLGRMPGTLMLSLQGEAVYRNMYLMGALIFFVCVVISVAGFLYRERVYAWIERMDDR